ncbi:MAG: YbaB/EbfC family nucleoid-associated protein [Verrucomicrobiae bacterium]|nr:YbaB/EbfC family nucleoid-associated protein [Verrucomicrobiae bacterium]
MNFAKMLKQAQQMQADMQRAQEEIAGKEFEGSSGGGAVVVRASGEGQLLSVKISPEAIKDGDASMLEDLVMTAANAALGAGREFSQQRLGSITSKLGGIPGLGL